MNNDFQFCRENMEIWESGIISSSTSGPYVGTSGSTLLEIFIVSAVQGVMDGIARVDRVSEHIKDCMMGLGYKVIELTPEQNLHFASLKSDHQKNEFLLRLVKFRGQSR